MILLSKYDFSLVFKKQSKKKEETKWFSSLVVAYVYPALFPLKYCHKTCAFDTKV